MNRPVSKVEPDRQRVFFIECSGSHWVSIARALAERHRIRPVLWTGDEATVGLALRAFPDIVANRGADATCGRFPQAAAWPVTPLDEHLLRSLAADESIALSMMDRMDLGPGMFDHDARRRLWHELLRSWGAALDALKPDAVIFSIAPHQIYDFALYALCRLRGIATRMFERAPLPGFVFLISRFEEGAAQLRDLLRGEDLAESLSNGGRQHIARLRSGGEGALPPNYRKKLLKRGILAPSGRQDSLGLLSILAFEARRALYLLLRGEGPPDNYFAHEDKDGRLVSPGLAGWIVGRWRGQWRKWRLRRLVSKLARPLEPGSAYVLLALHF